MAGYRGHVAGAIVAAVAVAGILSMLSPLFGDNGLELTAPNLKNASFLLVVCILGGLWPDVDTTSKGQKLFYILFFGADTVLIFSQHYLAAALLGYFAMLPIISHHRGWIHTKTAAVVLCLPIMVAPILLEETLTLAGVPFFFAALTGYLSHLALDGKL
ncbi:metal-dependent hydrolase [bacterium]|nr:metal-dependent hydrolase [candidate division CSSED10-310 bacterium]